ncbi:MAG: rhodanese-like domain-containing protein [Chloroflexota bacterium]|nr:rhodanese-like domain-containing protein [Chloroflexota bacterium]
MTSRTAAHLIAEAKAHVEHLTAEAVAAELEDQGVLLVDLREPDERAEHGVIAGGVHAPRGMLEFYADPTSAYFHPEFDPARRTILYCASGGRAVLAAETLTRLGYARVTYLKGGLHAWVEAGYSVGPST